MPIQIIDKLKPKNNGEFALVDAADIELASGNRLEAFLTEQAADLAKKEAALAKQIENVSLAYPEEESATELQPEVYYIFGEVDSLTVTLVEADDGKAHEYCFEFIPTEDFTSITITPAPTWAAEPQYPAGHTCQVSILRGIGVMVNA